MDDIISFIKKLQQIWVIIFSLYINVKPGICPLKAHSLMQCSNTSRILIDLFSKQVVYNNVNIPYNYKIINDYLDSIDKPTNNNIIFYRFNIFGHYMDSNNNYYNLPDHDWIILKYNSKLYMLQSYYNAYIFSGNYGFYEFNIQGANEFLQLMRAYNEFIHNCNNRYITYSEKEWLINLNNIFRNYTGISELHPPDIRIKTSIDQNPNESYGRIQIRETIIGEKEWKQNVYSNICLLTRETFEKYKLDKTSTILNPLGSIQLYKSFIYNNGFKIDTGFNIENDVIIDQWEQQWNKIPNNMGGNIIINLNMSIDKYEKYCGILKNTLNILPAPCADTYNVMDIDGMELC